VGVAVEIELISHAVPQGSYAPEKNSWKFDPPEKPLENSWKLDPPGKFPGIVRVLEKLLELWCITHDILHFHSTDRDT